MNNRARENATLSFMKPEGRGSVEETFFPWMLTVGRFRNEGLPADLADGLQDIVNDLDPSRADLEQYLNVSWGEGIMRYEAHLGFDPVRRIGFTLPFRRLDEKVLEDNSSFQIRKDVYGKTVKLIKATGLEIELEYTIGTAEDWQSLKSIAESELETFYTDENIRQAYEPLRAGHERGDYSLRLNLEGFFWTPRDMMGVEAYMLAFYDCPELIHDINTYILHVYMEKLVKVLDILPVDVVYIMEDLSGKNGPMISPSQFDEFIGAYYKKLVPVIKAKGVRHVIVDTDGDFLELIPNFIAAGIEGFLPMDVNAGMDIVQVRREYPELKFIGGFNKLCIADGKNAIDQEFSRLMPVIRQGGYIPGCDHQVAPSTSLENYCYYISKLKEAMLQGGADI